MRLLLLWQWICSIPDDELHHTRHRGSCVVCWYIGWYDHSQRRFKVSILVFYSHVTCSVFILYDNYRNEINITSFLSYRGKVCFWNGKLGILSESVQTHKADVLSLLVGSDQKTVYAAGKTKTISILDHHQHLLSYSVSSIFCPASFSK